MVVIGNLRAGRRRRHASVIAPCALGILALVGVVRHPAAARRAAELELRGAEQRVGERARCLAEIERFEAQGGTGRARHILESLQGLVPPPVPTLELNGLLRLVAERSRVGLELLEVHEARDPGLPRVDDVAALREVELEGTARLEDLQTFLGGLRALGRPMAVLDLEMIRQEDARGFRWSLRVGFFESRAPSEFTPPEDSGYRQEFSEEDES